MAERTEHGEERHEDDSRPTSEAFQDRGNPLEIYQDLDTGHYIYVGTGGRTHIFLADGRHHTSFRTTRKGRLKRVHQGRWRQLQRK